MREFTFLLAALVVIELLACGFLILNQEAKVTPPIPNLDVVDSLTGDELAAMANQTESVEEWHRLGTIYMSHGFFSEAAATLKQAVDMSPRSFQYIYDYAFCLSIIGDVKEANRQFERAIELNHPKSNEASYFIGRNCLRDENPEKAEVAFRSAIEIPIAKYELAKMQYRQGNLDEAARLAREVLKKEPGTIEPNILLSQIALKRGETSEMIRNSFEGHNRTTAVKSPFQFERDKLYANFATVGYGKALSVAYRQIDGREIVRADKGIDELLKVQWNLEASESAIQLAKMNKNYAKATRLIEDRFQRFGLSTKWLSELGQIQMAHGDAKRAVSSWKRGVNLNSDQWAIDCCVHLTNYYRDITGDKDLSNVYEARGAILIGRYSIEIGQVAEARKQASLAVALSPNSAEAHYLLGEANLGQPKAKRAFEKCVEIDPTHGRAIRRLKSISNN